MRQRRSSASRIWVSLFDQDGDRETERLEMQPEGDGVHTLVVPGLAAGARYGLRADGDYDPDKGQWFDPDKLLVDPYAVAIDRPYAYDAQAGGTPRRGRRHRAADAEGGRHRAAAGLDLTGRRCFRRAA